MFRVLRAGSGVCAEIVEICVCVSVEASFGWTFVDPANHSLCLATFGNASSR